MTNKKALMFHGSLTPYRLDFFNELNKLVDLKVIFFYDQDPQQEFDTDSLKSATRFKYDYLLSGFKFLNRNFRFGFFKICRKNIPEILITHEFSSFSIKGLIYKLLINKKIKWFITSDDSLGSLENLPLYRRAARYLILPHIDGLITINDDVKNWHLKNYKKLSLNIFSLPILHNEENFRNKLNLALPISNDYIKKYNLIGKKTILFVGRLVKVKGVDRLVQIFSTLEDQDIRLIIVGEGELRKSIEATLLKNNEKRIILTGRFDNLALWAWYNVGSVFILPSYYEPFGAVINEALLSGLFTLCSTKAGANCLIQEQVNGTLIEPLNNNDIKSNLEMAIKVCEPIEDNKIIVKKSLMIIDFNNNMIQLGKFINN